MKRRERGQITVMVIGFFLIVGLLAVVVINSSAAFLQRQELNNVADGAALAAADALRRESVYANGIGVDAPLDPERAEQAARAYLRATGESVASLRVRTDDAGVHVHAERVIDLAFAPPGWHSRARVGVDATAQLRVAP